jgi:hypothetical protein
MAVAVLYKVDRVFEEWSRMHSEARRDCKTCCKRKQDGIVVSE